MKVAFLDRTGQHEYIVSPGSRRQRPAAGEQRRSRYRELEATARYLGGERRDLTVSYVWARGTGDLNNYDQFFGNIRNPIVRENENNLIPTDVRHRMLIAGQFRVARAVGLAPVVELRSGFPWSAVDEFQDFVGRAEPRGAAASRANRGFRVDAAVATQEVPLPRRPTLLQHLRRRSGPRHAEQRDLAVLRDLVQPDRALDRHHVWFSVR